MNRRSVIHRLTGLSAALLVGGCGFDRMTRPSTAVRRLGANTVLSSVPSVPIPLIVAGDAHFKQLTNVTAYRIANQVKARLAADPLAWALYPGDIVENGTAQEFRDYAAVALNPILDRVLPVVGNHETKDAANKLAQSYFAFFGSQAGEAGKGYYAKTFGDTWAGVFLNGEWGLAEQAAWLAAVLPTFADRHIFAVLHTPYMSAPCNHNGVRVAMNWPGSGTQPGGMGQLWLPLERHGAEFLISGHVHRWERYPRMIRDNVNPFTGIVEDRGLRQFVCGTGGTPNMPPWTPANPHPHVEKCLQVRGLSEFVLQQNHYEWTMTDYVTGATVDSGTQTCHKTILPPEEPPVCPDVS